MNNMFVLLVAGGVGFTLDPQKKKGLAVAAAEPRDLNGRRLR